MFTEELLKINSEEIISRLMQAYGVTEQKRLAGKLQKTKQAVQGASNKGVPSFWILKTAVETGKSVQWITMGTEPDVKSGYGVNKNIAHGDSNTMYNQQNGEMHIENNTPRTKLTPGLETLCQMVKRRKDFENLTEELIKYVLTRD